MIDFYFACKDYFSYDIAVLINAWCFPKNTFNKMFMDNILKGYESIRKLQTIEKKNEYSFKRLFFKILTNENYRYTKKSKNKILEIKNPEDFLKRLIFHKNINNANYDI